MTSTTPDLSNPFPGLRCFQSDEDYLFFGRQEQIEDLLRRLRTNRLVAVVGTSGSGKSSLVRAGLLPAVLGGGMSQAGSAWEIAVMRPGGSPMAHLAQSLCDAGLYDAQAEDALPHLLATLGRSRNGLIEAVRQSKAATGSKLLLVVDQFEELFRFNRASAASQEESVQFVNLLLHATQQADQNVYIVLTMRSDFLGECSGFLGLAEAVNDGEFLIPKMTRDQIQEAIQGPIRVRGAEIAQRLLFRLLNDVEDNQDQLPVLQHALMRTWDLWKRAEEKIVISGQSSVVSDQKSGAESPESEIINQKSEIVSPLDLEDYEATGGMHQALSRHADEIFDALPSDPHRTAATRIFKALTERGADGRGIRRPTRLGPLTAIAGSEAPVVRLVIEAYRAPGVTFLMPPVKSVLDDNAVIDISHESLMRIWARLRSWVDEEAQSARIYGRLHETAGLHAEKRASLYHDPDLQIALSWRDAAQPNADWAEQYGGGFDEAMRFLDASREAAEREEKEREAARQRELAQARELAEAQRLRAEEQRRSARRLRAGMVAVTGVAAVAVVASFLAVAARREAQRNERFAKEQKEKADQLRDEAVAARVKLREEFYVADINRAGQAYDEGGMELLDDLLARQVPKPGEPDLRGPEWYFWRHASRRSLASVPGRYPHFEALAVAPDHQTIATANWPGTVRLFDVASRNMVKVITVEERERDGRPELAYAPDGGTLAVAGPQPYLRRWNTRTWQPITPDLAFPPGYTNGVETGGSPAVVNIAYSPDGSLLAGGSINGYLALWDTRTWQVVKVFDVFEEKRSGKGINDLAFSPDGTRLAAAVAEQQANQGTLVIWHVARQVEVFRKQEPSGMSTVAYSPDGRLLASGNGNGEVNLWNAASPAASPPEQLFKARGPIMDVAFSPKGSLLAASTAEGNAIHVWEMPSQRLVSTLKGHSKPSLISFVGDESTLWSAGQDNRLKVWGVRESGLYTEAANSKSAVGMSYLAGGRLVWRNPPANDPARNSFGASLFGMQRAGIPSSIQLFDVAKGEELAPWQAGEGFTIHAASANGRFLAAQGADRRLRLWNSENGTLLGTTPQPVNEAPNDTGLLAVTDDGSRVAWVELAPEPNFRKAIEFNLWSPSTGRRVRWPATAVQSILPVAFSPDGTLLATSGNDNEGFKVILWDVASERPIALKTIDNGMPAFAVAFFPDGTRLACGLWNGEIQIYEVRTGKPLGAPLLGHAGFLTQVAFSPDGRTLFSAAVNQTLRFWDADKGVRLATLPGLDGYANQLIVEPRGRWMAASVAGQAVRIWRLDDAPDPRRAAMTWWEDGEPAARRGNFTQAREAARKSTELAPDVVEAWLALAAIAVHEGDIEAFRKVRRDMLARFGAKPYLEPAALTAFVCTVLPASPGELETGVRLAERVAAESAGALMHGMDMVSLALGEYRRGHYAQAVARAKQRMASDDGIPGPMDLCARITIAMSEHQRRNPAEARRALTEAREVIAVLEESFSYPGTSERPSDWRWSLWILAKALLREAETLIEVTPTASR